MFDKLLDTLGIHNPICRGACKGSAAGAAAGAVGLTLIYAVARAIDSATS